VSEATAPSRRFRRGASILPSLFTTGNLFLGFWVIVKAQNGQFAEAAPLLFWAGVLDALDGRIARMTGTASEFGAQLDSLADVISFGVAPALLVYSWGLSTVPRSGWLTAFLFVMCGSLRLARFNVQHHVVDARSFVGMPIPAAAGQLAAVVFFFPDPVAWRYQAVLLMALVVSLAFLMVSTLRYPSFKGVDLKSRRSYINVLGIALLFLLVAIQPEWVLLCVTSLYTLSAPTLYVVSLLRRRGGPTPTPA
jgi:CDP-diacylglycerol--serine O-phosphatidyltransferase